VIDWGLYTALSQAFLKLISPGVPDIYQGQELWDFSLVDPDNRRPVDFERRRRLLAELKNRCADRSAGDERDTLRNLARELARSPRDPRLKLFLTWKSLAFRRRHADMFFSGEYLPLAAEGAQADHVCAFAWRLADRIAIAIAPRLLVRLTLAEGDGRPKPPLGAAVWHDTRLMLHSLPENLLFENVFSGTIHRPVDDTLPLGDILSDFPVALLEFVQ
jgi:(1->4)-alpha-D-glucan 1-alpha-D-glucosylmutase